jgi:hypothetical protein
MATFEDQEHLSAENVELTAFQNKKKKEGGQGSFKSKGDDPNWRVKTVEGESTLADIKRRQREELAEQLEEGQQKRFKIVNFTSEDSNVIGEKTLFSFYCAICGEHALTTDVDVQALPRRNTDKAMCLDEAMYFHKKYGNFGEKILLRRQNGVERQFRHYCKQCRQPLGYRSNPPAETSKFSYFYHDALVSSQGGAVAFHKV